MLAALETEDGAWSDAQRCIGHTIHPDREIGDRKYHRLFTVPLLAEEDRQKKIEEVSTMLQARLRDFQERLNKLESDLTDLP